MLFEVLASLTIIQCICHLFHFQYEFKPFSNLNRNKIVQVNCFILSAFITYYHQDITSIG